MSDTGATGKVTKATLLLSTRLNDAAGGPRPLSPSEYHQLAQWLEARQASLADLLRADARILLRHFPGTERLLALLARITDAENLIAQWTKLGIWVIGEREPSFPARLRQRLRNACLPLLFGAGQRGTLDQGGLCVVGSRDSAEEAHVFARSVGARAGGDGLVVISSDMRGIDREAISASLACGGRAICVLSDSLEKAVVSKRYRQGLSDGHVTLVTPFTPDTRFSVANAMRANRYQYGLSDAAIIVETRQTGGIWSGADENRKQGWVPAFVRSGVNVSSGNNALLHLGLLPITVQEIERAPSFGEFLIQRATSRVPPADPAGQAAAPLTPGVSTDADLLYQVFVAELEKIIGSISCDDNSIASYFGLEPVQARVWVARARHEGHIPELSAAENVTSN
jgi:predicted Rossmann fold nucleotide-binding protein DprA/Smf involved in DNA uptake